MKRKRQIDKIFNDDVLNIIYDIINIKCHTCHRPFSFENSFYIKVNKLYFCNKECYEFI